jgi:hypothetical protein
MTIDQWFQVGLFVAATVMSVTGYLITRTMRTIDHNQALLAEGLRELRAEIYPRLRGLELDHARLKAAHEINHGKEQ